VGIGPRTGLLEVRRSSPKRLSQRRITAVVDLSIETKPNEKRIGKREKKSLKRYLLEKVQAKVRGKRPSPIYYYREL
jgi:hypothetical protein